MNIVIDRINFPIYMFFILLSFICAFAFIYIFLRKHNVGKNIIMLSFLLNIVFSITGGKMFTLITNFNVNANILSLGLSSYGGAIGLIIGILIFNKMHEDNKEAFLYSYILSLPLMYSISKLGCFFVGCCHGINYAGPFNVSYIYNDLYSLFPVQLAETIVFMIIFILSLILYKKIKKYTVEFVFILTAIFKFSLDFLRSSHIGQILSVNQYVSIAFLMIAIILFIKHKIYYKETI